MFSKQWKARNSDFAKNHKAFDSFRLNCKSCLPWFGREQIILVIILFVRVGCRAEFVEGQITIKTILLILTSYRFSRTNNLSRENFKDFQITWLNRTSKKILHNQPAWVVQNAVLQNSSIIVNVLLKFMTIAIPFPQFLQHQNYLSFCLGIYFHWYKTYKSLLSSQQILTFITTNFNFHHNKF